MEEFTRSVGGYHFLYADTFLTRWWPFIFNFVTSLSFLVPGRNLRRCLTQLLTSEFAPNITLKVGRTKIEMNHIFCTGAFPHLYDKTKPEIDVVAVGKAYMDPLDA